MALEQLLVGKKDSARILGISIRQLEYLIAQGVLRAKRIGRRVLLLHGDLLKFAASRTPVLTVKATRVGAADDSE